MKNRINKLLKIGILCFAMALIQTSCEKNDNSIDSELQQEKKVSRVSFSDFNINVAHNRQYEDLEKHFDIKKSSNQNLQNRIDANDDITVLTDEILVIQKNDISYYTFKIVAPSENNEFYNLVVHVNNQQQIIKSELYEYIPDNEWLQDINQPYTGLVKVLDNDIISLDDLFSARGSGRCLSGVSGEWNCGANNNHEPGNSNCDPANNAVTEYVITLEYGPCPNEPQDYIIAEAPNQGGSGGGGGGSTPNQNPTPTIPTTPCEQNDGIATQTIGITDGSGDCLDNNIDDELPIDDCVDSQQIELNDLLSQVNNSNLSIEINTFLSENNFSCDAYQTAILFTETKLDDSDFSDYEIGPSCDSFNFQTTTTDAYWQNAAVKNIRFRVVVLSPQGNYINFDIRYSQPILFGVPTNMINGGDISSGLAAELSAQTLSVTMSEVVNAYGNQPVSEMQVRLYFEQRLKYNYPIITNGGRVTFNPMSLPVIPTEYQTNFFGTGNCD